MRFRHFILTVALAALFSTSAFAVSKFDLLAAKALAPEIVSTLPNSPARDAGFAVFFSVSDGDRRAIVRHATGTTLVDAWNKAAALTQSAMVENKISGRWLKADIVKDSVEVSFDDFSAEIRSAGKCLYRRGVSFDENFVNAYIEEELNGTNAYIGTKRGGLNSASVLQEYFDKNPVVPTSVYTFTCYKFFCDEDNAVYRLTDSGNYHGRRDVPEITGEDAKKMVLSSGKYLLDTMLDNGKFRYNLYPQYHKITPGYNLLRHDGAVWGLVRMCKLAGKCSVETKHKIDKAVEYMVSCIRYKTPDVGYMLETHSKEIKIGSNGLAIVALTEYMDYFGTDQYLDICRKLANGIIEQQEADGSYFHVLNEDFSRKEKLRIVYYDGEATFGLLRTYEMTKDKKYLDAAERAVKHFIKEDYTKHADHWIGYTMANIVKYIPLDEYVTFGIRNAVAAFSNGEQFLSATTMELLTQGFVLYDYLKKTNYHSEFFDAFDIKKFVADIKDSMLKLANRFFYPELAMYMANPNEVQGAFMVRHKWFRMRVDDVQHNMCGVYTYAVSYPAMEAYLRQAQ